MIAGYSNDSRASATLAHVLHTLLTCTALTIGILIPMSAQCATAERRSTGEIDPDTDNSLSVMPIETLPVPTGPRTTKGSPVIDDFMEFETVVEVVKQNTNSLNIFVEVSDANTSLPITTAEITLLPDVTYVVTMDIEGLYVIPAIPLQNYSVEASAPGYESQSKDLRNPGFIESLAFALETDPSDTAVILLDGFDAADTNQDGLLDFSEASLAQSSLTLDLFDSWDSNGDGFLSPEEIESQIVTVSGCHCRQDSASSGLRDYVDNVFLISLVFLVMVAWREKPSIHS